MLLDVEEYWHKTLESERGISISGPHGDMMRLRLRLNKYRAKDREASKTLYPLDDERYGKSPYDLYELKLINEDEGRARLLIRPYDTANYKVEEL